MSPVRSRGARYLVAPDSFKGTLGAPEVATAIGAGLIDGGAASVDVCPVADGGEGTVDLLAGVLGGRPLTVSVHDPLGRPLQARLMLLDDGHLAMIESAEASGLALVAPDERDPELASTAGTGELVAAAIAAGARRVLVAAGGSATTDGGAGAIEAIQRAGGLRGARIEVLCDVETPFERAAIVYGPQKGADDAAVRRLTARLERQAASFARDPTGIPMTGCAGGLSGGLWAALGAELHAGATYVFELLGLPARLTRCDAAVTGEGRLDSQSFEGKVVGALAQLCRNADAELHVIAGASEIDPDERPSSGSPPCASPAPWRRSARPRGNSHPARRPGRVAGSGGRRGERVVREDHPVRVPAPLDLGEPSAGLRRQDRLDVAGALGEVEVAALARPRLHRRRGARRGGSSIASPSSGVIGSPTPSITKAASSFDSAPPSRPGRPSAPPSMAELGEQQRRAGIGPGGADEGVDRVVGQLRGSPVVPQARDRLLRIHVDPRQPGGRDLVEGVHDRLADLAQRRDRSSRPPPGCRCRPRRG